MSELLNTDLSIAERFGILLRGALTVLLAERLLFLTFLREIPVSVFSFCLLLASYYRFSCYYRFSDIAINPSFI